MQIDFIDEASALENLRQSWQTVYDADPEANYFLSWTWMAAWLKRVKAKWLILAARPNPGSTPVAFLPIQLITKMNPELGFYNEIFMGGYYLAGYTGFLCDPAWQDKALPAIAYALRRLNWAALHLVGVNASEKRLALFTGALPKGKFTIRTKPRIDIADKFNYSIYPRLFLRGSMDDYLASAMGAATRKNARSGLRKLDSGEYRVTHADASTLERDLGILMNMWSTKWLPIKGGAVARMQAEDHRVMLRTAFMAGDAFVAVLWQGDTPIAGQGSLLDRKNNSVICLVGSRDLAVRKPAPSFLLHLHCIRWAIENRFAIYDMQLGNHTYKYDFGPIEHVINSHIITTSDRKNLRGLIEPRCLPVVFDRVEMLIAAGQFENAMRGCQQILQVDPKHAGARAIIAQFQDESGKAATIKQAGELIRNGKVTQAQQLLEPLAKVEVDNFTVRYLLGLAHLLSKNHAAARVNLQAAVGLNPEIAAAHNNLGCCQLALGEPATALVSFEKAISLDPEYAQAQANRDQALEALERSRDLPTPA